MTHQKTAFARWIDNANVPPLLAQIRYARRKWCTREKNSRSPAFGRQEASSATDMSTANIVGAVYLAKRVRASRCSWSMCCLVCSSEGNNPSSKNGFAGACCYYEAEPGREPHVRAALRAADAWRWVRARQTTARFAFAMV
jgi:hypothetical protein